MEALLNAARNSSDKFFFQIRGNLIFSSQFEGILIDPQHSVAIIKYGYNGFAKGEIHINFMQTNHMLTAEWKEMGGILGGNGYFTIDSNPQPSNLLFAMDGEWGDKGFISPDAPGRKGSWELRVSR